jgi:hypothetical protein
VRSLAGEGGELQLTSLRRAHEADRARFGEETERDGGTIGEPDILVLDVHGLLAPLDLALEGLARDGLRGGDHVHGHDPELSEDLLVVDSPKCGVVDDRLGPRDVRR